MRKQNYSLLLINELTSSRLALLSILTQKDELLYQKAPLLRREYMEKIGKSEQEVLELELECFLLRRKKDIIQTSINQRVAVDIEKINEALEAEKKKTLAHMEDQNLTSAPIAELTPREKENINEKYHRIIQDYHPAFNTMMTETEKKLYAEALDAYKRNNLQAVTIIYDMLYEEITLGNSSQTMLSMREEQLSPSDQMKSDIRDISDDIISDYTLAKELYNNFLPTEEDTVFINTAQEYIEQLNYTKAEVDSILTSFPFIAQEVLKDEIKINAYLEELKLRKATSESEKNELEKEINELLKES